MVNNAHTSSQPAASRPQLVLELAAVLLIALLYFASVLAAKPFGEPLDLNLGGLNPANRFGGIEYERLAGILLPVETGLKQYDRIPTWNPYLNTGTPLLNNAFNYLFNPFASLPVLLLGGVQGTKIAIFISLILAGWSMWALMKAIGTGAVARVAAGAFYLTCGGIAAKYYTGHFQLGLSLAWPPLVLAGLWWTLYTTDRRAPLLMAVAFALLFFSGNIYYSLHVILCCAFIFALHLFERTENIWHLRRDRLRRVLIGGLFALGLSAVQFIPIWLVRDFVIHDSIDLDGMGQIASRYEMTQAFLNYIYPWKRWFIFETEAFNLLVVVDYAYIGPGVFLFIAALAGLRRSYRKAVGAGVVLAVVMMIWGAGQTPILQFLYTRIDLLSEFRYIGRAHSIAALWFIVLGGIGIDTVWRAAQRLYTQAGLTFNRSRLTGLLLIVTLGWSWFFVYSLFDNTTRLQLALTIVPLYTFLNERLLTNYPHAIEVLWMLVALAFALESLFPLAARFWKTRLYPLAQITAAGIIRVGLIVLVLTAITDLIQSNSPLIRFGEPVNQFTPFYAEIIRRETRGPFPAVQEPFSPSAFDAYTSEIRNWLINEGWSPRPLPDIIPQDAPSLLDLPGWAIASDEYSGAAFDLAMDFINAQEHQLIFCLADRRRHTFADPCDFAEHDGAALYYLPQALPYAFIVPQSQVLEAADTITAPPQPQILLHQQDTIHILAHAPADEPYYLVVHETHFPGWQAFVDQQPVAPVTVRRFVGIPMQPGTHTYHLRYEPPGMAAGVLISVLSIIAAGFYLRGRRSPEA